MATVVAASRLAAKALAGRPASRLPHRSVAGESRTGATLPGGPAFGLRILAHRESPLGVHCANNDGARDTGGEAELDLFTKEDIWSIVYACTLTPIGLIGCLHELEQNYENGRQYWPLFYFVFFLYLWSGIATPLTYGFVRWQARERMRSQKRTLPVVACDANDDGGREKSGEAEPLFTTEEFWSIVYACVLTPIGLVGCLHELEQNYENGRQYWPLFYFVFFLYLCSGIAPPLTYALVRWQSRQRSQTRKQQE